MASAASVRKSLMTFCFFCTLRRRTHLATKLFPLTHFLLRASFAFAHMLQAWITEFSVLACKLQSAFRFWGVSAFASRRQYGAMSRRTFPRVTAANPFSRNSAHWIFSWMFSMLERKTAQSEAINPDTNLDPSCEQLAGRAILLRDHFSSNAFFFVTMDWTLGVISKCSKRF